MDNPGEIEHSFENPVTTRAHINWLRVGLGLAGAIGFLALGIVIGSRLTPKPLPQEAPAMAIPTPTYAPGMVQDHVPYISEPVETSSSGEKQGVSGQPQSTEINVTVPKPYYAHSLSTPLSITGEAPSNWFFEGEIPVKILDPDGQAITTGFVSEVTPGSWMSGGMVAFSGQVQFTTNAASGFLIIEKNNPSGNAENAASYEIPLNFDR